MNSSPVVILKVCPYVGASLDSLCVLSPFGKRAGFDGNTCPFFPPGVPSATNLIQGGSGKGGARAGAGYQAGFLLCSVDLDILLEMVQYRQFPEPRFRGLGLDWLCSR